jgi:hypothetical protein
MQRRDVLEAIRPLRDNLPEVAVTRLKKLLAGSSIKGAALGPVRLLLAEALVRAGKAEEGLTAVSLPETRDLPEAAYWRGVAFAQLQRYAEAEKALAAVPPESRYAVETVFTRASVLAALGQTTAALELLHPLTQVKNADTALRAKLWAGELMLAARRPAAEIAPLLPTQVQGRHAAAFRYLTARLAFAGGDVKAAADQFTSLASGGRGISPALQQAAALGLARSLQALGKPAEALGTIEKLIGQTPAPAPPVLLAAFNAFEQMNVPPGAEAENFLKIWAKSENPAIRILAQLATAAAQEAAGRPADALAACQGIAKGAAESELLPWVLLREAKLSLQLGNRPAVAALAARLKPLASSPAIKAWAAWLEGTAGFDEQKFATAAKQFSEAAKESTTPEAQAAAAYNAALAELQAGHVDPQAPLALLDGLGSQASIVAGAEFHLEHSLYMAAAGQPGAEDGLLAFVEALPDHPRRFEALVALAELALHATPAKPGEIQRRIADAAAAAKDASSLETVAWLKVIAAEKTLAPDEYASEASAFLTAWPQSARRAPLRMRLGEMYFRRQLFPGARQQFEKLEKDDPLHPLAGAALFWAGKSALLTLQGKSSDDDAIKLWERVFERGGPLKLEARLQVARLKQRRNDYSGALELLADIMKSKPPPDANTRRQVLCIRGEILIAQNASSDSVAQGLASFDQLVNDPQMPLAWRQEAMVLKGTSLEQLKRNDEALEAWYSVLGEPPAEGADDYWYHRAGEKALRMLEARQKYTEAIGIAGKMARTPGARGMAAAERVNQLALKYGIWLEMKPQ